MRPRTLLSLLIPLVAAGLFVRLGVWQASKHVAKAAVNSELAERLVAPAVRFADLPPDTASARWRAVTLDGRFRYDLEQILAGRTSAGSPGVYLLTPLERAGNDTLVMVTRGWVYSPDAASADLARWREADSVRLEGYALPMEPVGAEPGAGRPLRAASVSALSARLGRPVAPIGVVMTSDSAARADSVPRRLPPPTLDPGPHKSYAIQWFAFALIAVAGGVVLFRSGLREG